MHPPEEAVLAIAKSRTDDWRRERFFVKERVFCLSAAGSNNVKARFQTGNPENMLQFSDHASQTSNPRKSKQQGQTSINSRSRHKQAIVQRIARIRVVNF